jgi:hypothetical protein
MPEYVRGKVLGSMLVKALNLPPSTKSFDLHCALNDIVTVKCEYYPDLTDVTKLVSVIKEYNLVEK